MSGNHIIEIAIKSAKEFPYDVDGLTGTRLDNTFIIERYEDSCFLAARAVIADLLGRRGIKNELERVDLTARWDIILTLAGIIRKCTSEQSTSDHIKEVERLKELVIWMTGCGYDFTQHDFYNKEIQDLIWSEQVSLPGDSDIESPEDV